MCNLAKSPPKNPQKKTKKYRKQLLLISLVNTCGYLLFARTSLRGSGNKDDSMGPAFKGPPRMLEHCSMNGG